MFLLIAILFFLSIRGQSQRLPVPPSLESRQFTPQCANVCDFLIPLSNCQSNDLQCECSIVITGSVRDCAECLTLTLSTTQPPTTMFSKPVSPADCTSACEQYDNYIICASLDLACSCSAILSYGPVCSYCALDSVQQVAAGSLISDCTVLSHEGFPPYTSSSTNTVPLTTSLEPSTVASHAISMAPTATSSLVSLARSNEPPTMWDGFFAIASLLLLVG